MKTKKIKLAYFSPTGTSERVARGVADGIEAAELETIDITRPETREKPVRCAADELLLVAVPVYMGRVPALLHGWLNALEARETPAVCIVVYGNRAYEDSLLELKDTLANRGCIPVAGGAYIGEHSFSDEQAPVAMGRPNEEDLRHAHAFGKAIREKLDSVASPADLADLQVPGEHPYGGRTQLWDVDFIAVDDRCAQCGLCAKVCPVGAVDPANSAAIDIAKCITCCACIKKCPQNARSKKASPVMEASQRLFNLFTEPKKPEYFL
mgnify:CR=1 FL=1